MNLSAQNLKNFVASAFFVDLWCGFAFCLFSQVNTPTNGLNFISTRVSKKSYVRLFSCPRSKL